MQGVPLTMPEASVGHIRNVTLHRTAHPRACLLAHIPCCMVVSPASPTLHFLTNRVEKAILALQSQPPNVRRLPAYFEADILEPLCRSQALMHVAVVRGQVCWVVQGMSGILAVRFESLGVGCAASNHPC